MTTDAAPPPAKTGLLGKPAVLVGLLVAVMAVEFGVLYVILPKPHTAEEEADAHGHGDAEHDTVEVPVDSFSTTNSRAVPGGVIHLTFKLTAVVPAGQDVTFEHAANEHHKARVRQAVLKVARSSSLDDLNDPNLTTIKRKLKEEINKVLRKSLLTEVVISDFKTMEQ